jgi:hypothetical protein
MAWEGSALRDALAPGFESFQDWMRENDAWIGKVLEVVDRVGMIVGILSLALPFLGPIALALALLSVGLTLARSLAGTSTLVDLGFAAFSLLTLGTGKVLTNSAQRSVAALRGAQAEALVAEGMTSSLARATVARAFYRSRPRALSPVLFSAGGDAATAHLMLYVAKERPGASAAELAHAADLMQGLRPLRALAWAGQVQSVGSEVWSAAVDLRERLPLASSRTVFGTAW